MSRTLLITACLVAGCVTGEQPDSGQPTDTDPNPSVDSGFPAVITGAGVVTCAAPEARATSRFELRNAPVMPLADGDDDDALPDALLHGGGLVAADFNGDGRTDVFLPSEAARQFYVQDAIGDFTDVASTALGPIDLTMGVGGSAADIDGDTDLDLLVTRFDRPLKLLQNDGVGHFTDVTDAAGLGARSAKWQSSSWGDFDGDGDLDLIVGAYGPTPADAFEPILPPGDPKAFYLNDGDGTFTDRSDLLPPWVQEAYTFMTAWYDLDGDSYPELLFANDFANWRSSVILWNRGGATFELGDAGCNGFLPGLFAMGLAIGDLNGDRRPDGILTSYKDIAVLKSQDNTNPGCPTEPILWVDAAAVSGIGVCAEVDTCGENQQSYGWGAELADLDNDADLDAIVGYGWWSTYEFNHIDQPDSFYLNNGDGVSFTDASSDPTWGLADRAATRGILAADVNHDGWLDLLKRDLLGPTLLRIAHCGSESWVEFTLGMPPPNTHAIGARIEVTVGDITQSRWIESGSRSMYVGGPPEAHFGLGTAEQISTIEVHWPDGEVSRFFDQAGRQHFTITR